MHCISRFSRTAIFSLVLFKTAAAGPTFYKDVAPIVYSHCAQCHRPNESAPFSLLTYEDVKKHARQIVTVTEQRYMPPWLPEAGYGEFIDELRLTNAQIALLRQWAEAGAPAGQESDAPPAPAPSNVWRLGPPDLIVQASKPFSLAADGPDQFWNFVLPLPITETRWVKAIEIRPGNARIFHHANLLLDRSGSAHRRGTAPGAGFPGMDLSIEEDNFDPDSHFLFWKPSTLPWVEPTGLAWRATPGMDVVLNVHLQPSGKPEQVRPSIGLYFTDQPQTKFPMLIQLEHDGALQIPAGRRDFLVTDNFRLPVAVSVLAVYPHAHYLGRLLEGYATLPDGTKKWLIRIPDWDLNWQGVYHYRQPINLPKGSVLSMRFHYDNSQDNPRNPNHPPKRVVSGNNATDEMGHLWIQVLPLEPKEGRAALQEALMRHRLEKYPGDFAAELNLGALRMMRGDPADALAYFENAVKARPDRAAAHNSLGAALLATGKAAQAEEQFQAALHLDAHYTDARFNLGDAFAAQRQWDAAAKEFRDVLVDRPQEAGARDHLLEALLMQSHDLIAANRLPAAVECYREAVTLKPQDAALHANLGTALARQGRLAEAIPEFETALSIDPSLDAVRRNLTAAQQMVKAQR